ncbi:hypothetical protein D3C81_1815150 [compost metagenome]
MLTAAERLVWPFRAPIADQDIKCLRQTSARFQLTLCLEADIMLTFAHLTKNLVSNPLELRNGVFNDQSRNTVPAERLNQCLIAGPLQCFRLHFCSQSVTFLLIRFECSKYRFNTTNLLGQCSQLPAPIL